jgi:hypothetical protein
MIHRIHPPLLADDHPSTSIEISAQRVSSMATVVVSSTYIGSKSMPPNAGHRLA